jgi:hypothetical protein
MDITICDDGIINDEYVKLNIEKVIEKILKIIK